MPIAMVPINFSSLAWQIAIDWEIYCICGGGRYIVNMIFGQLGWWMIWDRSWLRILGGFAWIWDCNGIFGLGIRCFIRSLNISLIFIAILVAMKLTILCIFIFTFDYI